MSSSLTHRNCIYVPRATRSTLQKNPRQRWQEGFWCAQVRSNPGSEICFQIDTCRAANRRLPVLLDVSGAASGLVFFFSVCGLVLKWPHRPGYKCLLVSKGSLYSIQPYDSCEFLVSAPRNGCFGRMGAEKKEESPPRPYLARNSPTRCFTRRRLPCGRRGHACCTRALQKKKVE